jgi:CheY-like chemotaxis protein
MAPHEVEILLVEDNAEDAELTMRALKGRNLAHRLHWVKDGAEALAFLGAPGAGARPKLILLDLKLPKVDGLEVLRRVKADPRTRTIPVVVLTSSKEDRDIVASYELGVNSYVQKPVAFDGFLAAVSELGLYWLLLNRPPT